MRINAIGNNQIKVSNYKQKKNNVSFNGVKEILNTDVGSILRQKTNLATLAGLFATSGILAGLFANKMYQIEKHRIIDNTGKFLNDENYDKSSLRVKDFTNDGTVDFELTDKSGNKVIYDAANEKLLEPSTLQK